MLLKTDGLMTYLVIYHLATTGTQTHPNIVTDTVYTYIYHHILMKLPLIFQIFKTAVRN